VPGGTTRLEFLQAGDGGQYSSRNPIVDSAGDHAGWRRIPPRRPRRDRMGARATTASYRGRIVTEGVLLLGIGMLFAVLLLGGMWIPLTIGVSAIAYMWVQGGFGSMRAMGLVSWSSMNSFTLTTIPLFILMAEILQVSGLGHRAYRGMARLV